MRWWRCAIALAVSLCIVVGAHGSSASAPRDADDLMIVDCLLPGQLRQLAGKTTYLSARKPVKTTAFDCRVRSGEYVVEDRASLATALKVWLAAAEAGDPEAQTTVGEIFERGMGVPPDYGAAATWYRRAADNGFTRARINLGNLYEKGLGVPQDSREALAWYRRASGFDEGVALDTTPDVAPLVAAQEEERRRLQSELARRANETNELRSELERTRAELEQASRAGTGTRTELDEALARLAAREQELASRAQEVDALKARVAALEAQPPPAAVAPVRDADIASALLAGPEITLIDPVLPRTRGLVKVSIPARTAQRRIIGRVAAPAGLLSLTVNEQPTEPNPAGVFVAELAPTGESEVLITAIDRQGKRADLSFVLAPSAPAQPPRPAVPKIDFGRYYALLIGDETYRHLPRLHTPVADVTALDELLRTRFGFETTVLRDATRYEILSALNDIRSKLTSSDNLLVYYAGHGELDEVNLRGYWLPVDAEPTNTANWISNVTVTDVLNVIKAKQILLIVDSCYSGTLTRSAITSQDTAFTDEERRTWLELMAKKRARVVLTSGGLAPVLDAGGGRHSVFGKALLESLTGVDEITEGQALYRMLAARVAHAAANFAFEQTPQFAPIAHAGHESGDFFLLPR